MQGGGNNQLFSPDQFAVEASKFFIHGLSHLTRKSGELPGFK